MRYQPRVVRSPDAAGSRLSAASLAADAQQRPPEAAPGPRQPLLRPENPPALPVSVCGLLAAHLMPRATPDAAAPEDRFPRRQTPSQPSQLHPQASTESETRPMSMPTTIDGRAAIKSSLVRAWGLEGYARIRRAVREADISSDADFQRFYNRFYRVRRNTEWQSSYYAIMERERPTPPRRSGTWCARCTSSRTTWRHLSPAR